MLHRYSIFLYASDRRRRKVSFNCTTALTAEGHRQQSAQALDCAHAYVQQGIKTVTKHYIRVLFGPAVHFQGGTSPAQAMEWFCWAQIRLFWGETMMYFQTSIVNIHASLTMLSLSAPLPRETACVLRSGNQHKTPLPTTACWSPGVHG